MAGRLRGVGWRWGFPSVNWQICCSWGGLEIDKNAVQRIEAGKRFVTDIELVQLARVFKVSIEDLLEYTME